MGSHKKKGFTSPEVVVFVPPVPYLNVTGDITPDAKCNYFEAGIYGSDPYYRRADSQWFIWRTLEGAYWLIGTEVGNYESVGWWRYMAGLIGNYNPQLPATGTAVVALGGH